MIYLISTYKLGTWICSRIIKYLSYVSFRVYRKAKSHYDQNVSKGAKNQVSLFLNAKQSPSVFFCPLHIDVRILTCHQGTF